MQHKIHHLHFVGIGGAGMSGIAEVLLNQGFTISGSDVQDSAVVQRLQQLGARIFIGHDAQHIAGADTVVISSAITSNNPEVQAARRLGIPVIQRATMLAELMREKLGIAVAGTHGKTTTTSLIASVLGTAQLDPTFVIGGKLNSAGVNARLGQGQFIVVEADESDASFLQLMPIMSVITNIDIDHMETYGHNMATLLDAFIHFTRRLPFYGSVIACYDDANVRHILPLITCPTITYGCHVDADFQAVNIQVKGMQTQFDVIRKAVAGKEALPPLHITLNLPGQHNVLNALAAIVVAAELKIADHYVVEALAQFNGVGRRFNLIGEFQGTQGQSFTVIDDYAHHPTELAVTLNAARAAWPHQRIVAVFQPHRYTRTRDCFNEFVQVLSQADSVLLAPVYSAGESAIKGVDSAALQQSLHAYVPCVLADDVRDLPEMIRNFVHDGDIVLMLGAGSIGKIAQQFTEDDIRL